MEIDWDNWSPDEISFTDWCYEFVRLLRELEPTRDYESAMALARKEIREYMRGIPPTECVNDYK